MIVGLNAEALAQPAALFFAYFDWDSIASLSAEAFLTRL